MVRAFVAIIVMLAGITQTKAGELPKGFVYLGEVDAGIVQDMRYAGKQNFTGAPVPGYEAGECVLAEPVARALKRVQARFEADGKTLIVFDCYRPARAVRAFMDWTKKGKGEFDARYHPRVARGKLVAQGYIAARSGHSSGGSVDLTFGEKDASGHVVEAEMGGGFDLFDRRSHTESGEVDKEARANRRKLVETMKREGFVNYAREWWHFRHADEPFAGRVHDFPVTSR